MKSNARLDAEIRAVERAWDSSTDPQAYADEVASAIYHTLRWARGLRESLPSQKLINRMIKAGTLPGDRKDKRP